MGRESSHGRKELFNLPPLVLKARAPNDGSAFCIGFSRLEVPEQTLGGIPLGLGMVMKINFFEFSCIYTLGNPRASYGSTIQYRYSTGTATTCPRIPFSTRVFSDVYDTSEFF